MACRISLDLRPNRNYKVDLSGSPHYSLYALNPDNLVPTEWSLHLWDETDGDPEPFCQALEKLAAAIRSAHQSTLPSPEPLHPSPESDTLSVKPSDGAYDAVQVSEASPDDEGCETQSQAPQEARDSPQSS